MDKKWSCRTGPLTTPLVCVCGWVGVYHVRVYAHKMQIVQCHVCGYTCTCISYMILPPPPPPPQKVDIWSLHGYHGDGDPPLFHCRPTEAMQYIRDHSTPQLRHPEKVCDTHTHSHSHLHMHAHTRTHTHTM